MGRAASSGYAGGKGGRDRMVPLAPTMLEDLRRYWAFHRHPKLLFPHAGRGSNDPHALAPTHA